MSLTSILNEMNNSQIILDKSFKYIRNNQVHKDYPKPKNYTSKKVYYGFWNKDKIESYYKPRVIEKVIIKEIFTEKEKILPEVKINSKFGFMFDPYLEEEKLEITERKIADPSGLDAFELELNFTEDQELEQYKPRTKEYSDQELISMLNYNKERLIDVINTYDNYIQKIKDNDNERFLEIMKHVYNTTHSDYIAFHDTKENMKFAEKFPNMIDNKIKAIRKKNKPKNLKRVNSSTNNYYNPLKVSELRFKTVNRMLESRDYHNVNSDLIRGKIKELYKSRNLDIVNDIITNLDDQYGNDNDMLETNDKRHYDDHIEFMHSKYQEDIQYIDFLLNKINEEGRENLTEKELNDWDKWISGGKLNE